MKVRIRLTKRGSAVLYVIVLSPLLMFCLALGLETGALELEKSRLMSAADVAITSASSQISQSSNGSVGLEGEFATSITEQDLAENLAPLQNMIAGESSDSVAQSAQVYAVVVVPAVNPFVSGQILHRPTLLARMRVPVNSGLLGMVGLPSVVTLTVVGSADLRVTGISS